jgi:hypothetical protein
VSSHPDDDAAPGPPPAWRRVLERVERWRRPSPRVRGLLLFVAAAGTVVAAVLSVRSLELSLADLRWFPLLVAGVVITPLAIVLNGLELRALGHLTTGRADAVSAVEATRVVVLASAANLLPVPAGALLRVQLLHRVGASATRAAVATAVAAGAWIGCALLLTALGLVGRHPPASALAGGSGLAAIVLSVAMLRSVRAGRWRVAVGSLLLVELATAALQVVRLWLVLFGLGEAASLAQAAVIGAASPIAAAAGFFPGGLGLAELLSALLAPLAGLAGSAALLATAVARLLGLLATAPLALALGLREVTEATDGASTTGPAAHR